MFRFCGGHGTQSVSIIICVFRFCGGHGTQGSHTVCTIVHGLLFNGPLARGRGCIIIHWLAVLSFWREWFWLICIIIHRLWNFGLCRWVICRVIHGSCPFGYCVIIFIRELGSGLRGYFAGGPMRFCTPRFRVVIPGWLKIFCVVQRVVKVMLCGGACVRLLWRRSMGPHVSGIGWVVHGDLATGSVCTWNGCTVRFYTEDWAAWKPVTSHNWEAWFPGSHTWPGNQVSTHLAEDMHGISVQSGGSLHTISRPLTPAKFNV